MPAKLMGIVNVTPDSFYAGSRCEDMEKAVGRGVELYRQGADILDIGGESSRPMAASVSEEEELERVIPVIRELRAAVPIPLSVDTVKVKVAKTAVEAGAALINDVSGFRDPEMRRLAAESGVDICVMHMLGSPQTMQANPKYEEGVIPFLLRWFSERIDLLLRDGVKEKQIIVDPGIGFGKTVADNLEIIDNLPLFRAMGFPLLLGVSRKSFMSKVLGKPASELLSATLAVNAAAILKGVEIIRVHDVAEHRDVIDILKNLADKNV